MRRADHMLRVKVPCRDEGDFWARLADHVATNGIRIPAEVPRPVGARVRVGLEFKDGQTLSGDGVVDSHVDLDAGRGMCVRFLKLDRAAAAPLPPAGGGASASATPKLPPALPRPEAPLEEELFDDVAVGVAAPALNPTVSGEIAAALTRRGARLRWAAIGIVAAALVVAILGTVAASRLGAPSPEAVVAGHVAAADRLLAEGRLVGEGGALERLLAARRLRPGNPATAERLSRAADLLERLAASALERGDLPVASIHLASARLAAPDRASIRAKLAAVERARAAGGRRR